MKHVSASQITTFRDCPRKWYLQKIVKLPSPATAATELGSRVHEELEHWLRERRPFSDSLEGYIAASGAPLLPQDNRVYIELNIAESLPIKDSPVPVLGFIDALYPDSRLILDHKTSSNKRYTKTARELAYNVQLMLYAYAWLTHNDEPEVTVSHVYYGTRGARWSHRVDATCSREHVVAQWAKIKKTIIEMQRTATAPTAAAVTPNYQACEKYGGCPYVAECFNADKHTPHEEGTMTPDERMRALGLTEPQTTQATHATQATPKQEPKGAPKTKILYIGCLPIKGASKAPINVTEHFGKLSRQICAELNVPHLGLAPYGKGWAMYAGAVIKEGWEGGALYLDPLSKEYEHLVSPLSELADVVIRRF